MTTRATPPNSVSGPIIEIDGKLPERRFAPRQFTIHGITIRENPLIPPGNAMMISGDNRMIIKIQDPT